jgi:cysteine synthase
MEIDPAHHGEDQDDGDEGTARVPRSGLIRRMRDSNPRGLAPNMLSKSAAVGGGGLISGIGAAIKSVLPGVRIICTSPVNDAAMAASVRAGRVVQAGALPTISDGTAGGIEEGSITLPLCTELVDEWILVEEPEICSALRFLIDA